MAQALLLPLKLGLSLRKNTWVQALTGLMHSPEWRGELPGGFR